MEGEGSFSLLVHTITIIFIFIISFLGAPFMLINQETYAVKILYQLINYDT